MKMKLTEQQVAGLVKNYVMNKAKNKAGITPDVEAKFSDINIEKDAPNLSKFMSAMKTAGDMTDLASKMKGPMTPQTSTSAPVIPEGDEPMHPLGHKEPITSNFGLRDSAIGSKNHKGVDIATPSGSPVYAPLDGIVVSSRDTTPNPCGGFIQLSHSTVKTKFCHLSKMVVNQGDKVKKGQIIGYSGGGENDPHPGTSTGPHLHYEILNKGGIAMNPTTYQKNLA